MKRIFTILLSVLATVSISLAADVKIDKDNCTITKDGNTYPLYGEVKVVDSGYADLIIKVVSGGSCDMEVKFIKSGSTSSCGEWKLVSSGSCDFTVRFVESGSADLEIKIIDTGTSGLSIR